MELHLVPGGGGGDGVNDSSGPGRLGEAESLIRRTRQRLEEIVDRLAEIRSRFGDLPSIAVGESDSEEKTDPSGGGGEGGQPEEPPSV